MDLLTFLAIFGTFLALVTIMISFFLHLGGKMDGMRSDVDKEMKDFHGRLCMIEATRENRK